MYQLKKKMNREIYEFMRDVLHTDKVVFAITEDDFTKAKVEFVNHKKRNITRTNSNRKIERRKF